MKNALVAGKHLAAVRGFRLGLFGVDLLFSQLVPAPGHRFDGLVGRVGNIFRGHDVVGVHHLA